MHAAADQPDGLDNELCSHLEDGSLYFLKDYADISNPETILDFGTVGDWNEVYGKGVSTTGTHFRTYAILGNNGPYRIQIWDRASFHPLKCFLEGRRVACVAVAGEVPDRRGPSGMGSRVGKILWYKEEAKL
ncbi:hypothetical protein GGTG_02236 [Gaeumannomyces tritici R3-111a-1]|uniref:Uncharacterized protein n=1 Tax=Gaeumannomyces tritici (strain R3-111a-1) TaxID=644352 RepID=J3NLT6_GAET3|nr:hypothetical protein GGTG_02236 [Gaeumannomyces tritici R3-111a-1]EJT82262.1 hypothetical protein GGTG_02236 [Gaeumannomyces tritici R3-111a-1]